MFVWREHERRVKFVEMRQIWMKENHFFMLSKWSVYAKSKLTGWSTKKISKKIKRTNKKTNGSTCWSDDFKQLKVSARTFFWDTFLGQIEYLNIVNKWPQIDRKQIKSDLVHWKKGHAHGRGHVSIGKGSDKRWWLTGACRSKSNFCSSIGEWKKTWQRAVKLIWIQIKKWINTRNRLVFVCKKGRRRQMMCRIK